MKKSEELIRELILIKMKEKGLNEKEIQKIYEDAENLVSLYLTKNCEYFHEKGAAFIDGYLLGKI